MARWYALEYYRRQMVKLIRGNCRAEELSWELGCSVQVIRNWARWAELDEDLRMEDLTTAE